MTRFLFLAGVAAFAWAGSAAGQAPPVSPPPTVHDLQPAHVPLVMTPVDLAQPSASIWFKGDRPADMTIAKVTLRPVDAVAIDSVIVPAGGKPVVLWRAVTGKSSGFATIAELRKPEAERLYCADGKGTTLRDRLICLWDEDRNGAFDALFMGFGERGDVLAQLSILGPKQPLPKPIPYRAAKAEEAGSIEAAYSNCGKDHDRPRYSFAASRGPADIAELKALAEALRSEPAPGAPAYLANFKGSAEQMARLNALMGMQGGGPCRAAEPLGAGEKGYPASGIGKDALAVLLGELTIEVGSKDAGAPVRLLGVRNPETLYRLVGGGVEPLLGTRTDKQIALDVQQKFDKPVVMTAIGATVNEGARQPGETVLTLPIAHGYMGVLTADTKIRTLFSSRSLPAGTVLYGVPMSQRTVMTINGVPQGPFGPTAPASAESTRLVWCVPVEDKGQWTATCLPDQGGRYTLLKGQRPAFEVTSFSYDATTSTNDGPAPVEAKAGDFGKPLAYRFTLKSASANEIVLKRDTLFGDTVLNSRDFTVMRQPGEKSALIIGRGAISFAGDGEAVTVARVRDFDAGAPTDVRSGVMRRDAAAATASP